MKSLPIFLLALLPHLVSAQWVIRLTTVPTNTPTADFIYMAGSINTWDPAAPAYKLTKIGNTWQIVLNPPTGLQEFKFTRGSWPTVEGNASGGFLPNRTYTYSGGLDTLNLTIASWEDLGGSNTGTTEENVQIYDTDFWMPQLNRNRRIWVYLPPDYATTTKNYPVLYMQDGQNVFDAATSFSGEWEVDETLNDLHATGDYGCIVVAIDNGGSLRLDEYSPWLNTNYNEGGEGDEYVDFIVQTLKPHIDSTFRTLPSREYTGVMGSSLGALISHHAATKYQDVFSKVGDFSSAFWFNPQIYDFTDSEGKQANMKYYLLVGGNEEASDEVVDQTVEMYDLLGDQGFTNSERNYQYRANGTHSESFWKQEFGDAYEWLFGDLNVPVADKSAIKISLQANPADTSLRILVSLPSGTAVLTSIDGRESARQTVKNQTALLQTANLPVGVYQLRIIDDAGKTVWNELVLIQH
jgi:predicted alpha/beta superfamily hydrolase